MPMMILDTLEANLAAVRAGAAAAEEIVARLTAEGSAPARLAPLTARDRPRWLLSGNEAAGFGAVRGGVRFVAAYPITPATEVLEWLAPALQKVGGTLIQVEDELASINAIVGASYGGVPSLTATAGPGLSLMAEGIGLVVAFEVPVVVVDVMRGGPSTGIPAKSEQSDLSFAVDGLHGDAPRVVVAATSIAISGHLTPSLLGKELEKLKRDVPVYIYGPKPRFVTRIRKEIAALKRKNVVKFVQGRTYTV